MTTRKLYTTRSGAIRAARRACCVALDSKVYQAYEGPDYIIHPTHSWEAMGTMSKQGRFDMGDRWFFELRGPALEASK